MIISAIVGILNFAGVFRAKIAYQPIDYQVLARTIRYAMNSLNTLRALGHTLRWRQGQSKLHGCAV